MSVNAPPISEPRLPTARRANSSGKPILCSRTDRHAAGLRPRAWLDELPPLDAFGTLVFQVAGQQLSVASTRAIVNHLEDRFGGHMPSPAELLAADPKVLRGRRFSARKARRCVSSRSASSTVV
jgi:DNA-3-methyladenine glycosylase II